MERRAQPLDRAALNGWIESVVQHVDAWMSDEDFDSGARWNEAIAFHRVQFRFAMEIKGTLSRLLGPASRKPTLTRDRSVQRSDHSVLELSPVVAAAKLQDPGL